MPETVFAYLEAHRETYLQELTEFLRIPSISALAAHHKDVLAAADWLVERIRRAGFPSVTRSETGGSPVVLARYGEDPHKPTVLIYGHYDVQPVDPLEAWHHPPFSPTVVNDLLYARGASDDKGQLFMQLIAAEAWIQTAGEVPVNFRLLFEGEEEIGSGHLERFIKEHQEDLRGDFAVISDTPMFDHESPAICYGLRGLAALQIQVSGPFQDLHSGVYGGTVANPAHVLAHLIDTLHDDTGRVAVAHFYDGVDELSPSERRTLAALPFDETQWLADLGVERLVGEQDFTPLERTWARPTLEVNGMWSGFIGEGRKTIIPHRADAKITCRLVPHQDPHNVLSAVKAHLEAHCPPGVHLSVDLGEASPATLTPLQHPAVRAAAQAIKQVFGTDPVYIRMGGSIPVVVTLQDVLKTPTILLGFALPNENFHAPNEHFHLANFYRGAKTLAALWAEVSQHG